MKDGAERVIGKDEATGVSGSEVGEEPIGYGYRAFIPPDHQCTRGARRYRFVFESLPPKC